MNKFESIFSHFFESYIEEKQMQDFSIKTYNFALRSFDRFLQHINKADLHISEKKVAEWTMSLLNLRKTTLYRYQCIISNFCSYMNRLGCECYILRRYNTHAYKE